MRTCQKCNSEVREGSKICRVCGGIVDDVPPPVRSDIEEDVIEALSDAPPPTLPRQSSRELDANTADSALGEQTPLPWLCVTCGEKLDADFGICWKCGTGVDGTTDPDFKRADDFTADDFAASVLSADKPTPEEIEVPPLPARDVAKTSDEPVRAVSRAWTCPDCDGRLRRIKLIDRTGEHHRHELLTYASADADRGWFLGRFDEAGRVGARMCTSCGRILLYAEPN